MIYFDNHATTRVDPRVLEAMLPCFSEDYGNAASRSHAAGWRAEELVERARAEVAALIGAQAREIVFTSGATESDNLAVIGMLAQTGGHVITTAVEHKAVLDACHHLEEHGCTVTVLPVGRDGRVDPSAVADAITPKTVLVSVMAANNEIGTVQPLAEIGKVCRRAGVALHTDAVQAAGRLPLDVDRLGVDLLSLSAHKIYGPKGVGALYVRHRRPRLALRPITFGGGQERGLRSGTLNVPGIVGLGEAARLARTEQPFEASHTAMLRDRLEGLLLAAFPEAGINGSTEHRLPNNLNLSFPDVEGESLLMACSREVALSSGSACTSSTIAPSYVLRAIGCSDEVAHGSLRFGLGRFNTLEEVERVAELVIGHAHRLRQLSPRYHDRGERSRPRRAQVPVMVPLASADEVG